MHFYDDGQAPITGGSPPSTNTADGRITAAGVISATTGFQIGGAAILNDCLVGDGTNYVPAACPGGGGSMTWPVAAGIALYGGSSAWGTSIGWNAGTSTMTGNISGLAGTATALATPRAINGQNFNGTAPITTPVNNANDATNADYFPLFTATQGGNYAAKTLSTFTFHPSTGVLTAAGFSGPLTGNITGNASGTAATITGALALANTPLTARGDLLVATTATPILGKLGKGTQYQTLQGGATDPGYDAVHLDQATAVTGNLPWANQAHTAANVVALWTTCTGYLKDDGTCDVPGGAGTVTHTGGALTSGSLVAGGGGADVEVLAADPTQCTGGQVATGIDKTGAAKGCLTPSGAGTVTHTGDLNASANAVPVGNGVADLTASSCTITAGVETCTGFAGALTGAVTGNASTATALATPRAINGTSFDGYSPYYCPRKQC